MIRHCLTLIHSSTNIPQQISHPCLSSSTIITMNANISNRHKTLLEDDETIYLGDPDSPSKVRWEVNKGGHSLVSIPKNDDIDSPHELALFTTIIQISPNDCYLSSDNGWTGMPTTTRLSKNQIIILWSRPQPRRNLKARLQNRNQQHQAF